jgi:phosphoadenosine phosphosulfate reductase
MMALAFSGGKDSWACFYLMRAHLECAIYVDTGFAYPDTRAQVERLAQLLPVHLVQSDRQAQNRQEGIPADVVPVEWTPLGQRFTSPKAVTIQPSVSCCYANLALPLLAKAHAIGVTHLVYGQRADESHRGVATHGEVVEGIVRLHPIEDWTRQRVLDYIATHMEVPAHFVLTHSSLDCYDCTAYRQQSQDRIAWTKDRYPDLYEAYTIRQTALQAALQEALR